MRFFRINSSLPETHSWELGMPRGENNAPLDVSRLFTGTRPEFGNIHIPVETAGTPLDWTIAPIEVPVVSSKFSQAIERITSRDDYHLVPVVVDSAIGYSILVALAILDCIDMTESKMTVYPIGHYHKELVGKPQYIFELKIDKEKVKGRHLFRVKYNPAALIISEQLLEEMKREQITGIKVMCEV